VFAQTLDVADGQGVQSFVMAAGVRLYGEMESIRRILLNILHDPMTLVWPVVTFAVTFVIGWVVRRLVFRALRAWTDRTQSRPGLILAGALHGPMLIWALIVAVHLGLQASELPDRVTAIGAKALLVLWIVSLTIMCVRLAGNMVRYYGDQVPGALPVTTLTETLAELAVVVLGILLLLSALDFRITPILTALGVGGLAVALALQDTLSNLFSGFYVAVARQIRIADYIKLSSGEEGYVSDIGWRSTTIRALSNNYILIPNAKLAQAIVTNFHMPEKRMGSSFAVTVSYDADPERVEAILLEVVRRGLNEVPGMEAEPAPNIAFEPGFAESGLGFTVNYQVAEFAAQAGVRSELRRRVFRRLREEGIEIPYPARSVYLNVKPAAGSAHQ
jgi:small-conductance mechanosensitive channel